MDVVSILTASFFLYQYFSL